VLHGKITNKKDVEGIHVLNLSSRFNSVTDLYGNFSITVKKNDTLLFSSVQYDPLQVEITEEVFEKSLLIVTLQELVNELDEVLLGPDLSGNLQTDVEKIEVKDPITHKDLGIPGFEGVPEEKIVPLSTAITLTSVNIEAVYKHITGYYRKLRMQRKWDAENMAVATLLSYYGSDFMKDVFGISKDRTYDFVLFCVETTNIEQDFSEGRYNEVLTAFRNKAPEYHERANLKEE
jgi:hypothetical protein